MTGLPDEAVEAMARAYTERCGSGCSPRGIAAALAALPAGVYVSDGKGKVTPHTQEAAVTAMAKAFRVLPAHENREDWARRVLAALSAADTERSNGDEERDRYRRWLMWLASRESGEWSQFARDALDGKEPPRTVSST